MAEKPHQSLVCPYHRDARATESRGTDLGLSRTIPPVGGRAELGYGIIRAGYYDSTDSF
jgi:hypothetical protein